MESIKFNQSVDGFASPHSSERMPNPSGRRSLEESRGPPMGRGGMMEEMGGTYRGGGRSMFPEEESMVGFVMLTVLATAFLGSSDQILELTFLGGCQILGRTLKNCSRWK